jgi:hypothetical protein
MLATATLPQTVIVEFTPMQRAAMVKVAHGVMNAMMAKDSNAWLTAEYVDLENAVYAMTVDCAD